MSGVSVVSDQRSAIAKAGPGLSRLRCGLTQRKKAVRNSRGIRADGERDAIKARFEITSSATIVLARSQTTHTRIISKSARLGDCITLIVRALLFAKWLAVAGS